MSIDNLHIEPHESSDYYKDLNLDKFCGTTTWYKNENVVKFNFENISTDAWIKVVQIPQLKVDTISRLQKELLVDNDTEELSIKVYSKYGWYYEIPWSVE